MQRVLPSTDMETMALQYVLHVAVVYFTEYFSMLFQLSILMKCMENVGAVTCTNNGYQALFSLYRAPGLVPGGS